MSSDFAMLAEIVNVNDTQVHLMRKVVVRRKEMARSSKIGSRRLTHFGIDQKRTLLPE